MKKENPPIDILKVCDIAHHAGATLMAMREDVIKNIEIKKDGSPVTEADKAASRIVIDGLAALTPDIPVISEEEPEEKNRAIQKSHSTYWVVDPLDGTRTYIKGEEGFGVHIALIRDTQPVMAAIYFPSQGMMYYTDGISGAFKQKDGEEAERIAVNTKENIPPVIAVSWRGKSQPQQTDIAHTPVPSVGGGRVVMAAEGSVDLALVETFFSYWDIAAAHALIKAAGGDVYDLKNGKPVTYPSDRLAVPPCMAGHPDVVERHREPLAKAVAARYARNAAEKTQKPPKP